jgi:hypothetical protein
MSAQFKVMIGSGMATNLAGWQSWVIEELPHYVHEQSMDISARASRT